MFYCRFYPNKGEEEKEKRQKEDWGRRGDCACTFKIFEWTYNESSQMFIEMLEHVK